MVLMFISKNAVCSVCGESRRAAKVAGVFCILVGIRIVLSIRYK